MKQSKKNNCFFCNKDNFTEKTIILENDLFYARWDDFPVSKGHLEIIPKKHKESFFDLNNEEIASLFKILKETKKMVDIKYKPDGYNIGINEKEAAGRTIHHLHIHLIPRYKNDVLNPRGGIRNIIPEKGNY